MQKRAEALFLYSSRYWREPRPMVIGAADRPLSKSGQRNSSMISSSSSAMKAAGGSRLRMATRETTISVVSTCTLSPCVAASRSAAAACTRRAPAAEG